MAFLTLALARLELPQATIDDLTKAHRTSTCRQYESGWKKFQSFVREENISSFTPETLAAFATHVFRSKPTVSPATVTNAMVAIRDPVSYGLGIVVDTRTWDLLRMSFFNQRPPATPAPPSWSLDKVLNLLQTPEFTEDISPTDLLLKTVFLTAMATGHRVSQLAALLRTQQFMQFGPDDCSVTLTPRPLFLAKNEREGHRVAPILVPAWITPTGHHPLCPVTSLRAYVAATADFSGNALWVNPRSGKALKPAGLATTLVHLISIADPYSQPKAHQVRKYASTLAFFRSFNVEQVRRAGQWSSSTCFIQRYLQPHLSNAQCVAMGAAPTVPT